MPAPPTAEAEGALAFLQELRQRVAAHTRVDGVSSDEDGSSSDGAESGAGGASLKALNAALAVPAVLSERTVAYTNGDSYTGSMLGEQRHGDGTHTTSTGDVYRGGWRYDARHGTGTFTAASGLSYTGSWRDDKASGHGRCSYPDGSSYDGEWEADERAGWGVLTTADGQRYEGEFARNQPHGEGQWVYADRASHFRGTFQAGQRLRGQLVTYEAGTGKPLRSYTGSFKHDKRHGQDGVGIEEGLWVYRGAWRNDMRWGTGHCRYTDGSVFEGQWARDAQHGSGSLTLSDGTRYEGAWQEGQLHGVGQAKHASGERYTGEWRAGKKHGHGKWASAPKAVPRAGAQPGSSSSSSSSTAERREVYVGTWLNGVREGHGVVEYADGGRYEGSWRAGKRHGQGLMVFPDGCAFRGAWDNDEWLQSAAEPALCRLRGGGLSTAQAGCRASFTIEARDELSNPRLSGGDSFSVLLVPAPAALPALPLPAAAPAAAALDAPTGSPPEVVVTAVAVGEVQDSGDGSYTCCYSHTQAGRFMLHVTNDEGEHVADSPYAISVLPGAPSPQHSTVTGAGRREAAAGCLAQFEVTAGDALGNPLDATATADHQDQQAVELPIEARLVGSNTLTAAAVRVVAAPAGSACSYTCSYTAPATPGLFVLEVTSRGRHVGGSPFSVRVTAPADAEAGVTADTAAAAAGVTPAPEQQQVVADKVAWWGEVAREAYAAVDGCLEGWEDSKAVAGDAADSGSPTPQAGLSAAEAAMVEANPSLPVVERLEDLWLLSKLQQERKAAEQAKAERTATKPHTQAAAAGTATGSSSSSGGSAPADSGGRHPGNEPAVVSQAPGTGSASGASSSQAGGGGCASPVRSTAEEWDAGLPKSSFLYELD